MRSFLKFTILIGLGLLLPACAAPKVVSSGEAVTTSVGKTMKPGAAITITHEGPKDLQPSQYGVVTFKIRDNYDAGKVLLIVTTDDGLRLVSETGQTSFAMSGGAEHEWELDVTSDKAGIYYLNVFATTSIPGQSDMLRSYAARVQVGSPTDIEMSQSLKQTGAISTDGKSILMEATEVIQ